jgi:hypothetical protein
MLEDDPFFPVLKKYHEMLNETVTEYKAHMEHFGNYCAICGRIGQEVQKSLEDKNHYYCKDGEKCRKNKKK